MVEDIEHEGKSERRLDIRGGEVPGIMLLRGHDGFDAIAKMLQLTVDSWQSNKDNNQLLTEIPWVPVMVVQEGVVKVPGS